MIVPDANLLIHAYDATSPHHRAARLCTDAMIAAHADEHGGELHTADRDFSRFPTTRCRYPLNDPPPGSAGGPAVSGPSRR